MMVASEAKAAAQARREAELVAAADKGPRAYFATAGFGRLAGIVLVSAGLAVWGQRLLAQQQFLFGSLILFVALFTLSTLGSATHWGTKSRARAEARSLRKTAVRLLRKHRERIGAPAAAEIDGSVSAVEAALELPEAAPALRARNELDAALDRHLAFARKGAAREYTESIGGAIAIALFLRAFVFEPFHIPSGSMIPTLLVGDFIFVNKMSYGLRIPFTDAAKVHKLWEQPPRRGDVVVFINPQNPDQDYVKRVVGLPGDRVEIRDNVLFINGVEQMRKDVGDYTYKQYSEYTGEVEVVTREYVESLHGHPHPIVVHKNPPFTRSGSFVVEEGRAFMMGDNRDDSADSRVEGGIGQIPFSYIKGRATVIWISFGGTLGVRFDRLFRGVK